MNHTGRTPRLSNKDLEMIWLRYAIFLANRPAVIAKDYKIDSSYVSQIGKRLNPCQPHYPKGPLPKSRLISSPKTSNTSNVTSNKAGQATSEL